MAKVTVDKIKPKLQPAFVHRESSHARQAARRIGLKIPKPEPSLPEAEQEEADIA